MKITSDEINFFHKNGYIVHKSSIWKDLKESVKKSYLETSFKIINKNLSWKEALPYSPEITFDKLLIQINELEQSKKIEGLSSVLYEFFPKIIDSYNLLTNEKLMNLLDHLGCNFPVPATVPVCRIDRPNNQFFLTPWHQDYWYSLVSLKSITVWIPILPLKKESGRMEVIPSTHKDGIYKFKVFDGYEPYEAIIDQDTLNKKMEVPVEDDEILIFYQTLLHKSQINTSEIPRVTIQLRYNNLDDLEVLKNSFRPDHSEYVKNEQKRLLTMWNTNEI